MLVAIYSLCQPTVFDSTLIRYTHDNIKCNQNLPNVNPAITGNHNICLYKKQETIIYVPIETRSNNICPHRDKKQ